MLDIPAAGFIDKAALLGGCLRLPVRVDAARLFAEVSELPGSCWGSQGGRVGVHLGAEAIFLRGHAPAEGEKPVADRPELDRLPYLRFIIEQMIPARPMRCLLARLPAGGVVAPHVDRPPYFGKTLRLHVPVETNEQIHMWSRGLCYSMRIGEVWALNNSDRHAVWNAHPTQSRTHMICDFLPSPALLELLSRGERDLGTVSPHIEQHLFANDRALAATH